MGALVRAGFNDRRSDRADARENEQVRNDTGRKRRFLSEKLAARLLLDTARRLFRHPGCRWVYAASGGERYLFTSGRLVSSPERAPDPLKLLKLLGSSEDGLRIFDLQKKGSPPVASEMLHECLPSGKARVCRLISVCQGGRPLALVWLACNSRRTKDAAGCNAGKLRAAFTPLARCLLGAERLCRQEVPLELVVKILDVLEVAALLCDEWQVPLFANSGALKMCRRKFPFHGRNWVESGDWRQIGFRGYGKRYFVIIARNGGTVVDKVHHSDWAVRLGLEPRHARVGALLIRGLTDKEIAHRLGLSHQTVRTYVKELFQRTGCTTRHGFVGKALGAW